MTRMKAKPKPVPIAGRPDAPKPRFNPNPTKYRPEFCDALIAHMSDGAIPEDLGTRHPRALFQPRPLGATSNLGHRKVLRDRLTGRVLTP